MSRIYLEEMVADVDFDALPADWTSFDLGAFSRTKRLWEYQQKAIQNALKALWQFYESAKDYEPEEDAAANGNRKKCFFKWYRDNGLDADLDIPLAETHRLAPLLSEYYRVEKGKISYEQFINRASFWMATGSGKTLVLVKLIEALRGLIQRNEIPPNDILILTSRDDLIEQLKAHVQEFNSARADLVIRLRELREYAEAKRDNPVLFKERELTVFYYRSDNLNDEQKERIVDFRNYDDGGKWYVMLDEAHKGDREDSKRQQIYSILSRNGFLFSFSATFTDARDLATTVYNFNLSEFIRAGYGKHLAILRQEIRAFREDQDYNKEEKQKIVLKSLLMLAYAQSFARRVRRIHGVAYHTPLLLTLVNSVNTEEADLQLFFRELERIGKGDVQGGVWKAAKEELGEELRGRPALMFEQGRSTAFDEHVFNGLDQQQVLASVYNAKTPGEIEILIRPSNKRELAFKLRTSDRPFALIKIGDISGWLKDKLAGYEITEGFEDEGYFEGLNQDESDINILMGSRSFYEGWDSNRPNVINFVNIGVGADARKFILQAVGRGVRIEPVRNKRKRLLPLYNANEIATEVFEKLREKVEPLETLVIFGTNRHALQTVIEHLDSVSRNRDFQQLSLFLNQAAKRRQLLIPVYQEAGSPLIEHKDRSARFEIEPGELELLKHYVEYVSDDRVLMAIHDAEPKEIRLLKNSVEDRTRFFKESQRIYANINILVNRILDYFSIVPQEFEKLKEVEDEIRHFKQIMVAVRDFADFTDLSEKVEAIAHYADPAARESELKENLKRGKITLDQYTEGIKEAARQVKDTKIELQGKRLRIANVANHYYVPMILSGESDRIEYIKHVIQTPSEVAFVQKLEEYVSRADNKFRKLDWWMFSKIDETLDTVYLPYYDGGANKIRDFKPDFIFWLNRGTDYFVVFIDPKGTAHTDYEHKIDGYQELFEQKGGTAKSIPYGEESVKVFAFLYTGDTDKLSSAYKKYWFDDIDKALASIIHSA